MYNVIANACVATNIHTLDGSFCYFFGFLVFFGCIFCCCLRERFSIDITCAYACVCVFVCVSEHFFFFYFIESWKSVFWLRVAPQQFMAWHGLAWLSDYPVHFSSVSTQDSSHSVCSHLIIYKSWMRFFLFWCFQSMWTFLSFYLALSLLLAIRIRHFFHTLSLHVCVCVSSSSSFFNVVFTKVFFSFTFSSISLRYVDVLVCVACACKMTVINYAFEHFRSVYWSYMCWFCILQPAQRAHASSPVEIV